MTIINALSGETAYDVLNRGINEARGTRKTVQVEHNKIHVTVHPQSYIHDLCTIYDFKRLYSLSKKGL